MAIGYHNRSQISIVIAPAIFLTREKTDRAMLFSGFVPSSLARRIRYLARHISGSRRGTIDTCFARCTSRKWWHQHL